MILHRYLAPIALLLLAGCSSTHEQSKQLELLASSRAQLLSSQLPIESGPLSIMRASAQQNVIELMMIYNSDTENAPSFNSLVNNSVSKYCSDKQTRANLDAGLAYRIKIRNPRGQLMVDKLVSKSTCSAPATN
jgi:hypothetical protein